MKTITKTKVEKLLNRITTQAEIGKIEIGDETFGKWTFYIEFSKVNSKKPKEISFNIRDKNVFVENLKNYLIVAQDFYKSDKDYFCLSGESFCEKLILDLFVNATNFDLNNFENYIKQRTQMLNNNCKDLQERVIGSYLNCNIVAKISKNKSNLEGPYKFNVKFVNGEEEFILPSISFGQIKDELFLYSLQGTNKKQTNKLAKQLDRHFRKINKGVDMEDELLSQVSTNALVSLTIFLAYEKLKGINKLTAYNFMPIRYNSNLIAGILKLKNKNEENEFLEKHDKNQFNISNKFFNTIMRYAYHFNIDFEYDDVCENLNLKLDKSLINDENIIHDIDNAVINSKNENEKIL